MVLLKYILVSADQNEIGYRLVVAKANLFLSPHPCPHLDCLSV